VPLVTIGKVRVFELDAEGPPIAAEQDALDLIGETYGQDVELILIPVSRLTPDFFRLRTGLAGNIIQKLVNYGLRCAIIGDIAAHVGTSAPLADFVRESNRGGRVLFLPDRAALAVRLGG